MSLYLSRLDRERRKEIKEVMKHLPKKVKLKPCPFCGGAGMKIWNGDDIECVSCMATAMDAEHWNRRVK